MIRPFSSRRRRSQAVSLWPEPKRGPWVVGIVLAVVAAATFAGLAALLFLVAPPAISQTYVEAIADEPPLLNPILAPYTLAGQDVLPLVFSGLVRSDSSGGLSADLASSWEVSPDGRAYTFRLREGLTWHDGQPLDAQDVAFTIALIQAEDHQGSQELADLWRGVTVEVVDPLTVRFSLPEALASFPEHLTLGLLPRHVLEGVAASALPLHPFNRQPVGSGAYRVTALEPERIMLEPHAGYHGTPPRLAHIQLRYFPDRGAAVAALAAGQVDGLGHLRPEEIDRLAGSPRVVVYSVPERSKVATLSLNFHTPLFREKAIRLALGRTIDRDGLVTRALGGQAEPAFGPIPVQSWAYARAPGTRELDAGGAATLLEQAGWAMGPAGVREREGQPLAFTLLTADTPDRVAVARDLASQLARVGFRVQVRPLPADELTENHLEPRQFEAALVGQWTMGSDPDVYPQWHSSQATQFGGNYAGFSDPDVDRWLEVGRQQIGQEERRNAYEHFQARWAEELPSVVLYHPLYSFAVSRDVWGVRADPVPDSTWRLRDAVSWHRVSRSSALQRARTAVMGWLPGALRNLVT